MFEDFACLDVEEPEKREKCSICERPVSVCFCFSIKALTIRNKIIMLQHPMEIRRILRTTRILELSLSPSSYYLFRGKRFPKKHFSELYRMIGIDVFEEKIKQDKNVILNKKQINFEKSEDVQVDSERKTCLEKCSKTISAVNNQDETNIPEKIDENDNENETILVFPSENAIPISSLSLSKNYRIVFLDGTWTQARTMYNTNPILRSLKAVKIDENILNNQTSRYVIRTQPNDTCVSTVEAVALVLSHLEQKPEIYDILTEPLKVICDFQLQNGAVKHHSKEFLISNGLYKKQINKGMLEELEKANRNKGIKNDE